MPSPGQRLHAVAGTRETLETSLYRFRQPSARRSLVGTERPAGERVAPGEPDGITRVSSRSLTKGAGGPRAGLDWRHPGCRSRRLYRPQWNRGAPGRRQRSAGAAVDHARGIRGRGEDRRVPPHAGPGQPGVVAAGNRSALDQGRRGLAASGILMVKTEPRPASERISIEPPLFSMAARTTSMPTPRPDTGVTAGAVERPG